MVSLSEYVDRLRSVDTQAELAQYAVNYLKSSPGVLESYVSMQYQKSLNAWSLKAQITWPEGTPLWQMRFMEGGSNVAYTLEIICLDTGVHHRPPSASHVLVFGLPWARPSKT
jgi:hypothetical protein